MVPGRGRDDHFSMTPRRYALVSDKERPRRPGEVRRYSLARVAPASRSALGVSRLERMEAIAANEASSAR
jgi:hypothetical protein